MLFGGFRTFYHALTLFLASLKIIEEVDSFPMWNEESKNPEMR
jgi:hypothetical protein